MALGRGLGELLGEIETAYENSNEVSNHNIDLIEIDKIKTNPYQPRKIFNDVKLKELSESINKHGLLQPIVVARDGENFLLIAGERRLRATKLCKKKNIKAVILDVDDKKLRELALIENIQRDDLNIIEIANSYLGLIEDYEMTHEELSKLVSKSRSSVTNILRILTLSKDTQDLLEIGKISFGHAKLIIGLSQEEQKLIVDSIVGQKLSVKETELLVKKIKTKDDTKISKNNDNDKFDYNLLQNVTSKLSEENLDVKIDKNYFKIKINSQDDIEKIAHYFKII
ncbi:MAG: ParB/RepB/Spo0J family partition protein [Campylobacterota bacterium]|nr:ParB/RepB/Spo0J family partition protein [Campylobacterota bacterium]